jgi:hypothetical protein
MVFDPVVLKCDCWDNASVVDAADSSALPFHEDWRYCVSPVKSLSE